MPKFHIGRLATLPIQDHNSELREVGQFEINVEGDSEMLLAAPNKLEYLRRQIAAYLSSSILDTQVPVEYWQFFTDPKISKTYNLSAEITFGVR